MKELTVGELKKQLSIYKDSDKISFAGGLTLYRLKAWGDDELFVEFNEAEGYLSDKFKKRNPGVKVVFMSMDDVEWGEKGMIGGPIDVEIR